MEIVKAKGILDSLLKEADFGDNKDLPEAIAVSLGLINYCIENQRYFNSKIRPQLPRLTPMRDP